MTVLKRFACSADERQTQGKRMETTHNVAGIDVHKSMLAVVITDAAREGESGSNGASLARLRANCVNWPLG